MGLIELVLILVVIFWLFRYLSNKSKKQNSNQQNIGLTETQIRWRQQQQLKKESERSNDPYERKWQDFEDQIGPEEANFRRQLIEEIAYVSRNMRPFKFSEWMVYTIDPTLTTRYIFTNVWFFIMLIGIPLFIFGSPMIIMYTTATIVYDLWMYHVHRVFEVTEWNSEYQEKYGPKPGEY